MPKINIQKLQIIGPHILSGSTVWCLTVLTLSPVTHCHTGYIYVSATEAESIKIDPSLSSYSYNIYYPQLLLYFLALAVISDSLLSHLCLCA